MFVGLSFYWFDLGWLSDLLGIIGTIFGVRQKKGMATAGMVMSIISIALGLVMWIACVACVGAFSAL